MGDGPPEGEGVIVAVNVTLEPTVIVELDDATTVVEVPVPTVSLTEAEDAEW